MSAFPNNNLRLATAGLLVMVSMPAVATIVIDGNVLRPRNGGFVEHSLMFSPSASSYAMGRSHSWMRYQRGTPATTRELVGVPLNGAWMASSKTQFNARSHVARAQAYRLGERE